MLFQLEMTPGSWEVDWEEESTLEHTLPPQGWGASTLGRSFPVLGWQSWVPGCL